MSKRIKTFDELDNIEREAYKEAVSADLFFIRHAFGCIDGYFLIVSRDDCHSMSKGTYYIDNEDFNQWSKKEKDLFNWRYGFKSEINS